MEHATHEVKVDAIYKVAKLKKEVAYSDFDFQIRQLYKAQNVINHGKLFFTT